MIDKGGRVAGEYNTIRRNTSATQHRSTGKESLSEVRSDGSVDFVHNLSETANTASVDWRQRSIGATFQRRIVTRREPASLSIQANVVPRRVVRYTAKLPIQCVTE